MALLQKKTRIEQAIGLCDNRETKTENFYKGINILEEISTNDLQDKESRFDAIRTLYKIDREAAKDILTRIRDSLSFVLHDEEENAELVLDTVFIISNCALSGFIESHERVTCCVCLYNNLFIQESVALFERLALDGSLLIEYRIESCMYLIYTEDDRFRSTAIDVLTEVIADQQYPDKFRYESIICKFNSSTGLSTILNKNALNVEYDEDLLHILQRTYFDNDANDIRYVILSGQHLLQMKMTEDKERENITEKLLNIAKNFEPPEGVIMSPEDIINIKADAADVVLRLGAPKDIEDAAQIIRNLGFFETGGRQSLLTHRGIVTYVGDSQNIHNSSIRKAIEKFILSIIEENSSHKLDNFSVVHSEVSTMVYTQKISTVERMKAFKSLSRISIDTATFTERKLTSADVLLHLWSKLKRIFYEEEEEKINEIKKRFIDELIDMADTCSSGHAGRLANVLAGFGYGADINVSFKEQVIANASARMQTRIRNIEDNEVKQLVIAGMIDDADKEEIDAFVSFVSKNSTELRDELHKEFVDEGWVEEEKFNTWFESAVNSWTQKHKQFVSEED